MQAPMRARAMAYGRIRAPRRRQAAMPRMGASGYMANRCSQQRWQGGRWPPWEKYGLRATQPAATTAARAMADGATASTPWRPSRRRAGENRPPTARTIAATVAASATTASRARNSETVSVSTSLPWSALEGGQGVGGVDGPVRGERPAEGGRRRGAPAGGRGGQGVEHRHDLAQGAGRRAVLLLVGHVDLLDPRPGMEAGAAVLRDAPAA